MHTQHGGADCCEVFSVPRVNEVVGELGLRRGRNYDILLGDDLLESQRRAQVLEELRRDDPFCVMVSPPCTMFSQQQRPTNDVQFEKRLLREAIMLLNFGVLVCREQQRRGRRFVFEHPSGARSWKCKSLDCLRHENGVHEVMMDQCAFGLCDEVSGMPHKKSTRWLTTFDRSLLEPLKAKCAGEHAHQRLEGQVKVENE